MRPALERQDELLRFEFLGMASFQLEKMIQPLRDVVDSMKGWVLRMESFMEWVEASLGRLSLAPPVLQTTHMLRPLVVADDRFEVERGAELHAGFSPCAKDNSSSLASEGLNNDVVATPVLETMPQLQELCGSPVLPLPIEQLQVDPHEISSVALPPASPMESSQILDVEGVVFWVLLSLSPKSIMCQVLLMEHGASDVVALSSSATIEQVMRVSGMAVEPCVLAPTSNPDALFVKHLCDLLDSMEVVRSGLGRSITCLLTRTSIRGKQKKLRKGKRCVISKASLVA
ncbi:putative LRR receptor-like serine/threonine-protein kinase [Hordeum vulgare]|nr:putative LRR receptor-like serine/threonine-protein kinase [Hordeum vulgare]